MLLQQLWSKYWVKTIALSRNLLNREFDAAQLTELEEKIREAETDYDKHKNSSGAKRKDEPELAIVSRELGKNAGEQLNGVLSQLVKHQLFNIQ